MRQVFKASSCDRLAANTYEPRTIGDLLSDYLLHADTPLAKGYRMHMAAMASVEPLSKKGGSNGTDHE